MALLITKPTKIVGGIEVPELYVRLFITLNYKGNIVNVNTETYISKDAFNEGSNNIIKINGIPDSKEFFYNRQEDGIDLLLFVHNKMKEYLCIDEISNVPIVDLETGNYKTDENSNYLRQTIITRPKFVEENQVSFIGL